MVSAGESKPLRSWLFIGYAPNIHELCLVVGCGLKLFWSILTRLHSMCCVLGKEKTIQMWGPSGYIGDVLEGNEVHSVVSHLLLHLP